LVLIGWVLGAFISARRSASSSSSAAPSRCWRAGEHVDVAIRIGAVKGDPLVVRRIGTVEMLMFAAPTYLERHGEPQQPADLVEQSASTFRRRGARRDGACCVTAPRWRSR